MKDTLEIHAKSALERGVGVLAAGLVHAPTFTLALMDDIGSVSPPRPEFVHAALRSLGWSTVRCRGRWGQRVVNARFWAPPRAYVVRNRSRPVRVMLASWASSEMVPFDLTVYAMATKGNVRRPARPWWQLGSSALTTRDVVPLEAWPAPEGAATVPWYGRREDPYAV